MKVLFTQNIEGIAGSEKYFWQLLPALKLKEVEVEFLCVHKKKYTAISEDFAKVLTDNNIKVHFIQTSSYLSPILLLKIKSLLKKGNYDILHSHLIYADFWSAVLSTFFNHKTITVSTLHGYQEYIYTQFCLTPNLVPKNRYYKIARFCYKRIDHIYSCSGGLKNFFEQIGIKSKRPIEVIHHGFDYVAIEPFQENSLEFRCVVAGRLIPRKGHQFVIQNCRWLSEQVPNFKLIIVGDGPLYESIKNEIKQLELTDFVVMTGFLEDARVEMAKADLVLVPSYAEGLPLVIFEAMSLSKPVIAFDTIGPAEAVIDGETGYLLPSFDDKLFCEKIVDLSKNPDKRNQMGINAKKMVLKNFSLNTMTENTIRFYQTCLS